MLSILLVQAELTDPDAQTVERARTRLVVALIELADNPVYGEIHSDAAVVLDRLSDMVEDPSLRLGVVRVRGWQP